MSEPVSWHHALKPAWHWLLRRLPAVLFARWYTAGHLKGDIKIMLDHAEVLRLHLPKQGGAPSLDFSAKVLNASPYLDIRITRVSVSLSVGGQEYEEAFAEAYDWTGFDVARGRSRLCQLTIWPNEFQMQVVRSCDATKRSVNANVYVSTESAVGPVIIWKVFRRIPLVVK